jgi:hypothetical protein
MTDVLDEALEKISELSGGTYRPFDQEKHIPNWNREPSIFALSREAKEQLAEDIANWEAAHGHDVRQKCYREFGCMALEYEERDLLERLVEEVKKGRRGR